MTFAASWDAPWHALSPPGDEDPSVGERATSACNRRILASPAPARSREARAPRTAGRSRPLGGGRRTERKRSGDVSVVLSTIPRTDQDGTAIAERDKGAVVGSLRWHQHRRAQLRQGGQVDVRQPSGEAEAARRRVVDLGVSRPPSATVAALAQAAADDQDPTVGKGHGRRTEARVLWAQWTISYRWRVEELGRRERSRRSAADIGEPRPEIDRLPRAGRDGTRRAPPREPRCDCSSAWSGSRRRPTRDRRAGTRGGRGPSWPCPAGRPSTSSPSRRGS